LADAPSTRRVSTHAATALTTITGCVLLLLATHARADSESAADEVTQQIIARMKAAIIPEVAFRTATVDDVLAWFHASTIVPAGPHGQEPDTVVNFVLVPHGEDEAAAWIPKQVMPDMRDVSVYDALTTYCRYHGGDWTVRGSVVYVYRKGDTLRDPYRGELSGSDPRAETEAHPVMRILEQVVVPELAFRQAGIHCTAHYLTQASRRFAPKEWSELDRLKGVSIVLMLDRTDPEPAPGFESDDVDIFGDAAPESPSFPWNQSITYRLRLVPLRDALDAACLRAGLEWRVADWGVLISETNTAGRGFRAPYRRELRRENAHANGHERRIMNYLQRVQIPELDFRQANIHDVVRFLMEASQNFAPKPEEGQPKIGKISIVLKLDEKPQLEPRKPAVADDIFGEFPQALHVSRGKTVTFNVRYISLREALDLVCLMADLEWRIGETGIEITERVSEEPPKE
jgi:hypothetical protein